MQSESPYPMRNFIDSEICQKRLARIEPEHKGCKSRALITTPPPPHCDQVKMPYLNQMYWKKAMYSVTLDCRCLGDFYQLASIQNLKGLGSGWDPDLFLLESDRLGMF